MSYRRRKEAVADLFDYRSPDMSGVVVWHLVRTPVMREADAAMRLTQLGMSAFVPLQLTKKTVRRGSMHLRQVPVSKAALEGFVFIGLRHVEANWRALFDNDLIRAVVTMTSPGGRKPYPISNAALTKAVERMQTPAHHLPRRKPAAISPGEKLRVVDDDHVLWGREYEALSVEDGYVSVLHFWFGKSDLVEIPLDAVRKVA